MHTDTKPRSLTMYKRLVISWQALPNYDLSINPGPETLTCMLLQSCHYSNTFLVIA